MTNNESNNSGWIFLAGLATGAVIGYLVNSDRGREMTSEAAGRVQGWSNQATNFAQEKVKEASSSINSAIEQGKAYASDLSSTVKSKVSKASSSTQSTIDEAENAFQRGADKAQANLKTNTN